MIDWLSVSITVDHLTTDDLEKLLLLQKRILKISPLEIDEKLNLDGELNNDRLVYLCAKGELREVQKDFESVAWDSIKSDSHGISFKLGADRLFFQGSPARVIGDGDNVFSSGASAANDIISCVARMVNFLCDHLNISLPDPIKFYRFYKVTRIDITFNLLLPNLEDVRQALAFLRNCEGGRYRVSQQSGDTVYWSHGSQLKSGKAYAKGPHIKFLTSQKNYEGRSYNPQELDFINRLLRLELSIKSQLLRESTERLGKEWFKLTPADLKELWEAYFMRMLGTVEIQSDEDIFSKLLQVAETEGRAKAAYSLWLLIQNVGWDKAKAMTSKTSYYRNKKYLELIGLNDADISAGKVVPIRRKLIEVQPINSWADVYSLMRAA